MHYSTDLSFWGPVVPRITSALAHKVAAVRRRLLSLRTSRRWRNLAVSKPGTDVVFAAAPEPIVETAEPSASPSFDTALDITARLPQELLCRILDVVDFSLKELLPIRLLSHPWRAAVHAHPEYSRDIIVREPPHYNLSKPDQEEVMIPLASFASRISCSERLVSLCLSAQFSPTPTALAVIALIAQHLHRVQHLDVVFDPAHAPALFRALERPAPQLESFIIKFGEVRLCNDETWDYDDVPCHQDEVVVLPRTVFAGQAPRLQSLTLQNIDFPSSCECVQESLYGAFLNVQHLVVLVTQYGCAPLADVLDICPSLQDLELLVSTRRGCTLWTDYYTSSEAVIGSPVHPLQSLRMDPRGSAALPRLFSALAYQEMPDLALVCPSEEGMHMMFSHLADATGPLIFTAYEDTAHNHAYMTIADPRSGRTRTIDVDFELWFIFDRQDRINNMLSGGLALVEPRIGCVYVTARNLHTIALCGLRGDWTSVTVLRIDIESAEDAAIVAAGRLPHMESRFPRLELVLVCAGPDEDQTKVEDFARRAALRFFPQEVQTVCAASTSLLSLADNIMDRPSIALTHEARCCLWKWDRSEETADIASVESLESDRSQY